MRLFNIYIYIINFEITHSMLCPVYRYIVRIQLNIHFMVKELLCVDWVISALLYQLNLCIAVGRVLAWVGS